MSADAVRSATDAWWVVAQRRPAAALKLFCFPYAGGSAAAYRSWAFELPAHVEVAALQLPGRAGRIADPPFTCLRTLTAAIGRDMVARLDRPFALFGHSLGAVLAFEVTRWLRRHRDRTPFHLFVSGRRAPQLPDAGPPNYLKSDADLVASLREMNGTPPEILDHAELLALMLPVVRADFELVETYHYGDDEPLECPITSLGGTDDPDTDSESLDAWRRHTTGPFARHLFDGDHFFISQQRPSLLQLLDREMTTTLDARAARSPR